MPNVGRISVSTKLSLHIAYNITTIFVFRFLRHLPSGKQIILLFLLLFKFTFEAIYNAKVIVLTHVLVTATEQLTD